MSAVMLSDVVWSSAESQPPPEPAGVGAEAPVTLARWEERKKSMVKVGCILFILPRQHLWSKFSAVGNWVPVISWAVFTTCWSALQSDEEQFLYYTVCEYALDGTAVKVHEYLGTQRSLRLRRL